MTYTAATFGGMCVRLLCSVSVFLLAASCGAEGESPNGADVTAETTADSLQDVSPEAAAEVAESAADTPGDDGASALEALPEDQHADGGDAPPDLEAADAADALGAGDTLEAAGEDGWPVPDSKLTCLVPVAGMGFSETTKLCPGTYVLDDATGEGALAVVADGVTLVCEGTEIVAPSVPQAADTVKTVGIRVAGRKHVHVHGCAVRGYHTGIQLKDSSNLLVTDCDLRLNFDDPSLAAVGDTVQGGGLSATGTTDSTLDGNLLAFNWNALELRSCRNVTVEGNDGRGASNFGLLMTDSHQCTIVGNDFSAAGRGLPEEGSAQYYVADTLGAGAIVLDSGSSGNAVVANNTSHSAAGILLRAVFGGCPHSNLVQDNDASHAADAGVFSACNYGQLVGNLVSDSEFGMWLGASDYTVVRSNRAERCVADGISVHTGSSRHNVYADNLLRDNGRAGLLVSGKAYPVTAALSEWQGEYFNASHGLILANRFSGNGAADLFLSAVTGFDLVSNCGDGDGLPVVVTGQDAVDVSTVGACTAEGPASAPAMELVQYGGQVGVSSSLTVPSTTAAPGAQLTYYWLVMAAGSSFGEGPAPAPMLSVHGGPTVDVFFGVPGVQPVGVTVTDGISASLAASIAFVAPAGTELAEGAAALWQHGCGNPMETALVDDTDIKVIGKSSLRADTQCAHPFWLVLPSPEGGFHLDADSALHMFVRSHNPNGGGWQGNFPRIEFKDAAGKLRAVYPESNVLAQSQDTWIYVPVPVAGQSGWKVDDGGADLSAIASITFVMDTHGWDPYQVWVDGCVVVP